MSQFDNCDINLSSVSIITESGVYHLKELDKDDIKSSDDRHFYNIDLKGENK